MVKKATIPDAWEDDWEAQADKAEQQKVPESDEPTSLTKAERFAKHAETNRKLWESAETPETNHYLEANTAVPLASTFKPQVRVLSRKPLVAKKDPITGLSQLAPDDELEEEVKKEVPNPEEERARQQREREEKQRRYDEARAKIFGDASTSGNSSPGTVTPPRSEPRQQRGRGRGRGGQQRSGEPRAAGDSRSNLPLGRGELWDPDYAPKPGFSIQTHGSQGSSQAQCSTPKEENLVQPVRAPKGPDGSGRGGFGFAPRGAKDGGY